MELRSLQNLEATIFLSFIASTNHPFGFHLKKIDNLKGTSNGWEGIRFTNIYNQYSVGKYHLTVAIEMYLVKYKQNLIGFVTIQAKLKVDLKLGKNILAIGHIQQKSFLVKIVYNIFRTVIR